MPELLSINGCHFYDCSDVGGVTFPSVTTILNVWPKGPFFAKWLADQGGYGQAEEVKNAAARRGTKVHHAIDHMIGGATMIYDKEKYTIEEWKMMMGFVHWFEDYRPVVIRNESAIFSLEHGYAGTMDLFCSINGKFVIIDFKTSSAIHTTHRLQLQAYARAVLEQGETVDKVGIVRVGSKHKRGYEFLLEDPDPGIFSQFLHAKAIWEFETPPRKQSSEKLPNELSIVSLLSS